MHWMRLAAILSAGLLGVRAYADDNGRRSTQNRNPATAADDVKHLEVQALRELLVGEFDSSAQAAQDAEYFPITLRMVECWKERNDGPWLYVEQAMGNAQDKPYRQRVYRLLSSGVGKAKSEVYEPDRRQSVIECPLSSPDRAPVHMMTSRAMVPKPRLDFLL